LGGAKPQTAEDLLGSVLALKPSEQQRLIALVTMKFSDYLEVQEMIDIKRAE
jgi:hypothetical protein